MFIYQSTVLTYEKSTSPIVSSAQVEKYLYTSGQKAAVIASTNYGKALIELPKYPILDRGDVVYFARTPTRLVVDEFDEGFKSYLYSQRINIFISIDSFRLIKTKKDFITNIKAAVGLKLQKNLYPDQAGLVAGVLWGDDALITKGTDDAFKSTGLSHLVAVSGFNVGVIILLMNKLKGGLPKLVVTFLSILVLILFNMLVGFDNLPATRATLMGSMVLLGNLSGRPNTVLGSLAFSVVLILLWDPVAIASVSYQLSASALLGILVFYSRFERLMIGLPTVLREGLGLTLAANLATMPVSVITFGGLSVVSPLANLVVAPFIPLLMLLGTVGLGLSFLFEQLHDLWLWPSYVMSELVISLTKAFSTFDWAYTTDINVVLMIGVMLFLLFIYADYRITSHEA